MIPRPPVPGPLGERIDLAMSGPRMLALVQDALPVKGAAALESVQPIELLLRPGRAPRLRYALRRVAGAGDPGRLSAHLALPESSGGWRGRSERGTTHDRRIEPGARLPLPALGSALEILPCDRGLPGLPAAFDLERVGLVLTGGAQAASEGLELRRCRLLEHHPGRRAVLRYSLRAPAGADYVYGQLAPGVEAARLAELGAALARTGLLLPSGLAGWPAEGLLLQGRPPGAALLALTPSEASAQLPALRQLCRLLAALGSDASGPRLGAALARLPRRDPEAPARAAAGLVPELGARITRLAERAAVTLAARSHGMGVGYREPSAERLRATGRGIALDDLAAFALGPREQVAAGLAADLALRATEGRPELADLRADWLAAIGADFDPLALAAAETLALLERLAEPLARLEPDWPERMAERLALAERRLPVAGGSAGRRSRRRSEGAPARAPIPRDPALPQLEALADMAAMTERLREVLDAPGLVLETAEPMRHKPGRRCLLRYRVRRAGGEPVWLIGKTFASSRGPRVAQLHRLIHARSALGPTVRVPEVLAYLPDVKLLLLAQLPGEALAPRLLAGDGRAAAAMAGALASLHGSELELEREHGLDRELAPLDRRLRALEGECPELGASARRALALLGETLEPWRGRWRRHPAHRDCYHEQFLYGPAGLAALDFDDAAMADPCLDAGNLLAHLCLLGWQFPSRMDRVARARGAFERGLADSAIDYPKALLAAMECASLLRLVAIHRSGPDGARVARGLLLSATARLRAARLEAGSAGRPPRAGLASAAERRA